METTGPEYRIRVNSDLVLVNVSVRDKHGNLIRDLKQSDFTVLEDGKPHPVRSFDIEDVERFAQSGPAQVEAQGTAPQIPRPTCSPASGAKPANIRDRRLIVLFFDLTNMEPDELNRASQSALHFIDKQMTPADLVAVVSFSSSMQVNQDFTSDHDCFRRRCGACRASRARGWKRERPARPKASPTRDRPTRKTTPSTTFSTPTGVCRQSPRWPRRCRTSTRRNRVLYFSSGMDRDTGNENQSQLRAAINVAIKSNVSLYPVDSRGLEAIIPGGGAKSASLYGKAAYNGNAITSAYDSNFKTQETLVTLASDTGGKAFLDSNDFSKAFAKVQADMESYYVLGYRSSNPAMDGHYRKITVKVNRPDVKLDYRRGYYGPRDFRHFTRDDRDRQMEAELNSDLPNISRFHDEAGFRERHPSRAELRGSRHLRGE